MNITATLLNLAVELERLGDTSTADAVNALADDHRAGLLDNPAVLYALDDLITLQQVE